jgi:hypothetical protein
MHQLQFFFCALCKSCRVTHVILNLTKGRKRNKALKIKRKVNNKQPIISILMLFIEKKKRTSDKLDKIGNARCQFFNTCAVESLNVCHKIIITH